jgi:hypothetical protein
MSAPLAISFDTAAANPSSIHVVPAGRDRS